MVTIHVTGRLTPDGKVDVDWPDDLPKGRVEVVIELDIPEQEPDEEPDYSKDPLGGIPPTYTDEEVAEMLTPKPPLTGKEIVEQGLIGGWEDMGIDDSVEFVLEMRRKRRRKFGW